MREPSSSTSSVSSHHNHVVNNSGQHINSSPVSSSSSSKKENMRHPVHIVSCRTVSSRVIPPDMQDYRDKDAMMEDLKSLGLIDSSGGRVILDDKKNESLLTTRDSCVDDKNQLKCPSSPSSSSSSCQQRLHHRYQVHPEKQDKMIQGFCKSSSSPSVVGASTTTSTTASTAIGSNNQTSINGNPKSNFMMMGFTNLMIEPEGNSNSSGKRMTDFSVKKSSTLKSHMTFTSISSNNCQSSDVPKMMLPTRRRVKRPGLFARFFSRLPFVRSNSYYETDSNHHYECNKKKEKFRWVSAISNNKMIAHHSSTSSSNGNNPPPVLLQCRYCLEYYSPPKKSSRFGRKSKNNCQPLVNSLDNMSYASSRRSSSSGKKSSNKIQVDPSSTTSSNKSVKRCWKKDCEGRGRMTVTDRKDDEVQDCEYAPDRFLNCIKCITCMCCVSACMYHCIEKDEDDTGGCLANDTPSIPPTSSCSSSSTSTLEDDLNFEYRKHRQEQHAAHMKRLREKRKRKRCIMWTVLSFFIPCLWCYPCLKGCHSCVKNRSCLFGLDCCVPCLDSCVGGKHEQLASVPSSGISSQEPSS